MENNGYITLAVSKFAKQKPGMGNVATQSVLMGEKHTVRLEIPWALVVSNGRKAPPLPLV